MSDTHSPYRINHAEHPSTPLSSPTSPSDTEEKTPAWRLPLTPGCWPLPTPLPMTSRRSDTDTLLWDRVDPFDVSSTSSLVRSPRHKTADPLYDIDTRRDKAVDHFVDPFSIPDSEGIHERIDVPSTLSTNLGHERTLDRGGQDIDVARERSDSNTTLVPMSFGSDCTAGPDDTSENDDYYPSSDDPTVYGHPHADNPDTASTFFKERYLGSSWASPLVEPVEVDEPAGFKDEKIVTVLHKADIHCLLLASHSTPPNVPDFDYFTHSPFLVNNLSGSPHAILPWLYRLLTIKIDKSTDATTLPTWNDYRIAQAYLRYSLPECIASNEVVMRLLDRASESRICFHGFGQALNDWASSDASTGGR